MSDYEYDYTYVPPLAMAATVPHAAKPTLRWTAKVVQVVLVIAKNRLSAPVPGGYDPYAAHLPLDHLGIEPIDLSKEDPAAVDLDADLVGDLGLAAKIVAIAGTLLAKEIFDPFGIFDEVLKEYAPPKGRPTSVEDYRSLFRTIPLPPIADTFTEDVTFGQLRVAGYNPLVIRGVDAPGFAATDAHLAAAGLSDTLAAAGAEGRLYLADYGALANVVNGNFPDGPKYLYAPKALFVRPRDGSGLVPVAIQCDPALPVFGPGDGEAWSRAKTVVNCADANHHELVSHLGETHLLVEPFAIATPRRLAADHPVRRLLEPHYEGTLSINDAAQRTLITAGHQVDMALGGTIDASRAVSVQAVLGLDFEALFLPRRLADRRVTDPALAYPYRDDALQLWGALRDWVEANVVAAYADDDALRADADLAAWAAELAADDGGRLKTFGEGARGVVHTRAWLTDALTLVVFTASCQHAAVNFAQALFMSYAPAVPGALYRAAPLSVADTARSPALDLLPPLDMASVQLEFLTLLGSVHYTVLGQYEGHTFRSAGLGDALATLQSRLAAIDAGIDAANHTRIPYTLLKPTGIPQSINI